MGNILFTRELHRRYHAQGLNAVAFHPGFVGTNFAADTTSTSIKLVYGNPLVRPFLRSAARGADQLIWMADTLTYSDWQAGQYYQKRRIAGHVNAQVENSALAADLWQVSADLTDTPDPDEPSTH